MPLPKPDRRGDFFGQTVTSNVKVSTGKRFSITTEDDETAWIPIKETRIRADWVWDSKSWITGKDFDEKFQTPAVKKKITVSKNDFTAIGEPNRWRRL